MLGVVAATDKTYLLETLARWILDRTDKETAFAANFAFMRIAAANRIITSCALTNMATGALVFLPGADYPVMALAQVGMLFELAAVFGRGIKPERGYEVAGVLAGGLVIRAVTRALVKQTPHIGFAVKGAHCCRGTYGMGPCASFQLYEQRCRLQQCQRGGHCHVLPRSRSGDHGRGRYPSYGVLSGRHQISLLRGFPLRVAYQDCFHLIEPLLAKVEKPSRYIDHEWGTLSKADADYRCCLIYPDVYEVGLPNQGIAIL